MTGESLHVIHMAAAETPVFGLYHAPAYGVTADIGVVLVPPFGWDEVCSYRARRVWAQELSRCGRHAIRSDLPRSGDSGGSWHDPRLLDTWTEAVSPDAAGLVDACGVDRVV